MSLCGLNSSHGERMNSSASFFAWQPCAGNSGASFAQKPPEKQVGLTMIECMIVLAIVGIIVGVAGTSLMNILPRHRLNSAASEVRQDILQARMEAVKSSSFCTLVFDQSVGGTTFDYIVFQDSNGTADLEYQAGEPVLLRGDMSNYKSGVRIDTSANGTGGDGVSFGNNDDGKPVLGFNYRGLPRDNSKNFGSGSVFLTNDRGEVKQIQVNPTGRVVIR
jgi:prepilin-type N-terminal cleavage/methylation domain-containing protein